MNYNIIEDAYITQKSTTERIAQLFNKKAYDTTAVAAAPATAGQPGAAVASRTSAAPPLNRRETAASAQDAFRGLSSAVGRTRGLSV